MKIGTKSILFGVHQFLWHPFVVLLAWRYWHKRWPATKAEWLAIAVHDLGYIGCADMDGEEGKEHPLHGARFAWSLLRSDRAARQQAMELVLGHSKYYCAKHCRPFSDLYAPDKISVLFEPEWFYLLRGRLTGEIKEFMSYAPTPFESPRAWLKWYKQKTRDQFYGKAAKR